MIFFLNADEKHQSRDMQGTHQFVLLQVQSLQFTASFRQRHHAFIRDTVALAQVDVLQFATVLSKLKRKQANNI